MEVINYMSKKLLASAGEISSVLIPALFRKKFNPALIDLIAYEKDLLYQREHGIDLRPVPALPGGDFTDGEYQAMRDNYAAANIIYNEIRNHPTTRNVDDVK